jgi:hypothetical protein
MKQCQPPPAVAHHYLQVGAHSALLPLLPLLPLVVVVIVGIAL